MIRALPARELLHVWEQGLSQPLPQRALTLLAAACPDTPPVTLAGLSIGRRDAQLLALREQTFGPRIVALATCPACGNPLELDFGTADIQAGPGNGAGESVSLDLEGYHVAFRLPDSTDLLALELERAGSADNGQRQLLQRCLLTAQRAGQEVPAGELPAPVVAAISEVMGQTDPQADVELALRCPACEHAWTAPFDVLRFFWNELTTWAQRLLQEVHLLASAYGWCEEDILAMSALRRRLYLEMIVQ